MENKLYLAVDIGASSGRHILGWLEEGKIRLEEVYRFENKLHKRGGRLCWDMEALFSHVLEGMRACAKAGKIPCAMGIDTWALDFLLVGRDGAPLTDPVAYRDSRTQGLPEEVDRLIPPEELYARTGIQRMEINTIYQLAALQKEQPGIFQKASRFLMAPDYLHYRLTGVMENEYTNATTTSLINAREKTWDRELLERLGLPPHIFGEPRMPGTVLGGLLPEIQQAAGFNCQVVLPATHDTGSAFLAVPALDEEGVTLSSGTWSLLGVENREPVTTEASRRANFTNEGGYQYRFRYLKNIMGLWMLQSLRREFAPVSFGELEQAARAAEAFPSRVDVNHQSFLAPESMAGAVRDSCETTGQQVPQSLGELAACVYHSLAACYRDAIQELESLTGKRYRRIHIVGGGSRDSLLNELTARETGLPVYAGPTEGTALGNLLVQMEAGGEFSGLLEARACIRESFPIEIVNFTEEEGL